ncbi:reverse transcriptase [Elysia marginata]|uniref:Reverse transcriptase n=1 Tax=Elysia marginata TaxID=1093978 RepID=A0AAV4JG58_9GAST|nr:reverse transcriptase [Elysia marginata]
MKFKEKEAELLRIRSSDKETTTDKHTSCAKVPTLPVCQEERDEMESHLLRFVRFAATNSRPREQRVTCLGASLSAETLDTHTKVSGKESKDYNIVRTELLKRFNLNVTK